MTPSTYIIAEIGINHNGSLDNCYKMIDVAAETGCQAAKFQLFSASRMYPRSAGTLDWKDKDDQTYSYDIYEAVEGFELPYEWIDPLIAYCDEKGVDFMASVFDLDGVRFLAEKGVRKMKLSSYTVTHIPLIRAVAETKIPVILSTGGATLGETEEAIRTIQEYHNDIAVLHCSIKYPTPLSIVNMGVMDTLGKAFPEVATGYSDHTEEPADAPVQSVYLGGTVVEKHITLDKTMDGPDHFFALEPDQLREMVDAIREAEKAVARGEVKIDPVMYGSTARKCHEHEQYLRDFAYMFCFAARTIKAGERIHPEDIAILRPGKKQPGLAPKYLKLFQEHPVTAKREIRAEDPILWDAIL